MERIKEPLEVIQDEIEAEEKLDAEKAGYVPVTDSEAILYNIHQDLKNIRQQNEHLKEDFRVKFETLQQFLIVSLVELQECVDIEGIRKLLGAKDARIRELEKQLGLVVENNYKVDLEPGWAIDDEGTLYHIETRNEVAEALQFIK